MAQTKLIDDAAAFVLFGAVAKQAHKDMRYKTVKEQDKYTAREFLKDLGYDSKRPITRAAAPIRPR